MQYRWADGVREQGDWQEIVTTHGGEVTGGLEELYGSCWSPHIIRVIKRRMI